MRFTVGLHVAYGNVSTGDRMDGFSVAMFWLMRYGDVDKRGGG